MPSKRNFDPHVKNNSGNNDVSLTGRGTTKINKSYFSEGSKASGTKSTNENQSTKKQGE
ncbi:hypothetical protein NLI92_002894 [Priestia megaterium]|uniref:hypothetical protein n=1 Tax=Priestia megaterium TaxID=1404 RepID=UPI0021AD141B|nr:hypothetical protein [Priestia megaterium]MCR8927503.1 hypothetical protein [Priestia megaterium]